MPFSFFPLFPRNSVHHAQGIVGQVEVAVGGELHIHRAALFVPARQQPAADEILVGLNFTLVIKDDAHHFVAGGHGPIPRAVKGNKQAVVVFRR